MRVASKFLCGIISLVIQRAIKKCCGTKTKVSLDSVMYSYDENGKVNIHIKDFDLAMGSKEFEKLVTGKLGTDGEE